MNFNFSSEHISLKNSVREFAEKEVLPQIEILESNDTFSIELTKKMGELGLFGVTIPKEYGGAGMDTLANVIAIEELARIDASQAATLAAGYTLGVLPIFIYGTEAQKEKYLPILIQGNKLWGFALTEPNAGSDAANIQTRAVLNDNKWVVNGSKIFITNASTEITLGSTILTLTDITSEGKKEYSCLLVENGTPGFVARQMKNKLCWKTANTSELYFDNVEIPEENILGKRGAGFKQMLNILDGGKLAIAAMGLGGAQGAYELVLKYSKQRKQFGKYISQFQVNAFKLADMATEIEVARSFLYNVCLLKDTNQPFTKEAAMSKLFCSELMKRVVNNALQIFGGYGVMEEYKIARFYRDQRILEIGKGQAK
jgi:short-chain 2-methylacyl-CoA dehydrogenase